MSREIPGDTPKKPPKSRGRTKKTVKEATRPVSKQRAFLAAFRELGNVTAAAAVAKCDRCRVYRWKQDPQFAMDMAAAAEEAAEHLEAEARRRAVEGTEKPVFHKGVKCGTIREYSDLLLIFLLKGAKPEKYRENHSVDLSGQVNSNVKIDYGRRVPSPGEVRGRVLEMASRLGVVVEQTKTSGTNGTSGASANNGANGANGHKSNGQSNGHHTNGTNGHSNGHH